MRKKKKKRRKKRKKKYDKIEMSHYLDGYRLVTNPKKKCEAALA